MDMIRMRITNRSDRAKAVPRRGGSVTVNPGKSVEADLPPLSEERLAFWRAHGVTFAPADGGADEAQAPEPVRRRRRRKVEPVGAQRDLVDEGGLLIAAAASGSETVEADEPDGADVSPAGDDAGSGAATVSESGGDAS